MSPSTIHHPPFLHRCARDGMVAALGILLLAGSVVAALPTNNDPTNQIRFNTAAGADAKRQQLIHYIWPGGLPTSALPTVTSNIAFPGNTDIDQALVSRVDKLDAHVSGMDFHAISYLLHPANTANANRLAIIHQGHQGGFGDGLSNAANRLLQRGFFIIAVQMPMTAWNTDNTVTLPGGGAVTIHGGNCVAAHREMFVRLTPPVLPDGAVFRFFLEPVVQNINYFKSVTPRAGDVTMIGLSGGGWATNMAAALDTRIKLSVPVAGSAPLYARNKDPRSVGDPEQFYTPLYDENIAPNGSGGGVATWLEIYALGGYGDGRRQIMVTNLHDPCCFSGTFADTFKEIVASVVSDKLGKGQWNYFRDSTNTQHSVSPHVIDNVIVPALATP